MHMHVEYRMHFGLQLQRYRSKKKVQRLSKAQKDLLPTKRLMEKDSSASGKKKGWRNVMEKVKEENYSLPFAIQGSN